MVKYENIKQAIKEIISDVLGLKISKIKDNLKQQDVSKWDSLKHIELTVRLESHFNVFFEPEEISLLTSINAIENIVMKKLSTKS